MQFAYDFYKKKGDHVGRVSRWQGPEMRSFRVSIDDKQDGGISLGLGQPCDEV